MTGIDPLCDLFQQELLHVDLSNLSGVGITRSKAAMEVFLP